MACQTSSGHLIYALLCLLYVEAVQWTTSNPVNALTFRSTYGYNVNSWYIFSMKSLQWDDPVYIIYYKQKHSSIKLPVYQPF